MKLLRWVLGASVFAMVGWQSQTQATVVRAMPLGELLTMSEWVVVGTVQSSRSYYETIGGSRRMVTDSTLLVTEALTPNRGSANVATATVTVRTLGGTVGEVAQLVPGEAVLPVGSTHLLFLDEARGDAIYRVAAMAQGQYPVATDAEGNRKLRPSPGLDVVVEPQKSAVAALAGRTVEQAQALVSSLRKVP